jgi:hypothetical protein
MPPRKGTKSKAKAKGKGKAKIMTPEPVQEAPVQVIDEVDEREEAKQTLMEIDSAPVEEVKAEEPVQAGMTSRERVQKLAALRAKMVSYHQPCLSAD